MRMGKINSTFDLEQALATDGFEFVIGIDEAGRGPLAGPVVAAATLYKSQDTRDKIQANFNNQISSDKKWGLVRDSKKLSEKQREVAFDFVHENFFVGVVICNHETIDRINILEATFLAMKSALSDLKKKIRYQDKQHIIIVDGNKEIPNLSYSQKAIVGGDGISKTISAASIVAKVTRDKIMLAADEKFPQYGFGKHKGYGTKVHMEALQKFGPCEIHRQTFEPMPTLAKNKNKY